MCTLLPQVVRRCPQQGVCRVDVDGKSERRRAETARQLPDSVLRTSSKSFDPLPAEAPTPLHPTPPPTLPNILHTEAALLLAAKPQWGSACRCWEERVCRASEKFTLRLLRLQGHVLVHVKRRCTAGDKPRNKSCRNAASPANIKV